MVDFVRQITAEEKECGKAIERDCQVWYANLLNGMLWLTEQLCISTSLLRSSVMSLSILYQVHFVRKLEAANSRTNKIHAESDQIQKMTPES